MKSSGTQKKRDSRGKMTKLPRAAYIWGGITAAFILMLFILFMVSGSGASDTHPLLLIYSRTETDFRIADPAFENTVHAAGFEYKIISSSANEIPSDIQGRDVVVMGVGEDSFALMRDIYENELGTANPGQNSITGYILVDPKYPGNLSVERYDFSHPDCPVAMFGFGKKAGNTDTMSDVRRLFERMSGVDTVYGAYATRGAIMSSRVYFSADQNRYLSLYDDLGYTVLLNSPSFQSDLASYLASTYGTTLKMGRLNSWFILLVFGVVMGIASLLMFLFFVPVPERRGISLEKIGDDGMAAIVNMGLTIWFAVLIVAGCIIPFTRHYVKYVVYLSPLFMMLVMVLMRTGFALTNKIKYRRDKQGVIRTLTASVLVTGFFVAIWLIIKHGNTTSSGKMKVVAITSFLLDFLVVSLLGFIDKKSRAGGENGCSYYGNIFYPLELLIPSGTSLVISFMGMCDLYTAIRGMLIVIIPFICSNLVKRISDNVMFAALCHSVIFTLLLL